MIQKLRSRSNWREQFIVGLLVVSSFGILISILFQWQQTAVILGVFGLVFSLGLIIAALGLYAGRNWGWGLSLFLLWMSIFIILTNLVLLGSHILEAYKAGQQLNLPGILSRIGIYFGALALIIIVLKVLARSENRPASALAFPYIGPMLSGVLVFSVYPILYNVQTSLTNRNMFRFQPCPEGLFNAITCPTKGYVFVGLDNYVRLVEGWGSDFWVVIFRTLAWTVGCILLTLVVGLFLALLLNSTLVRARTLYRTLLIIPWAVPYYISASIWKFFFNGEFGTINNVLRNFGWSHPPVWLNHPGTAFAAIILINVWMTYPFFMTLILGALQAIPKELYEAAEVDGASAWKVLRQITLPLIRPAILPGVILSALTTFKLFETVWMVTGGGPFTGGRTGATEIVMVYAYRQAFQLFNYGYISAFATLVFILLFALTLINLRATRILQSVYQ